MATGFMHALADLVESIQRIKASADLVLLKNLHFQPVTTFTGVGHQCLTNALPMKLRLNENGSDFIADHGDEPDDSPYLLVHPGFGVGQVEFRDVPPFAGKECVTKERMSDQ